MLLYCLRFCPLLKKARNILCDIDILSFQIVNLQLFDSHQGTLPYTPYMITFSPQ